MNIAIIGFKGTGKSTICELLARNLGKKSISIEEEITKQTKLNIPKFVRKYGLDRLYDIESEVIERVSNFDDCVFDTTYKIIKRNENIINLKRSSLIVLLTADIRTIISRTKINKKSFDFAKSSYELKSILSEHEHRYRNAADYLIDTSKLSPQEICDLITHFVHTEVQ